LSLFWFGCVPHDDVLASVLLLDEAESADIEDAVGGTHVVQK
jgi:hypothetical protein